MVSLASLWLPLVLSAVIVFVGSSVMHMLLKYHRSDYSKIPDEDKFLASLRPSNLKPGLYVFPHCEPKDMKSPAAVEKYKQGPVGFLTIIPNGPPMLPKFLIQWFGFCLLVGFFVAYLAAHTIAFGASYLAVFRVVGTAAFLCYGLAVIFQEVVHSIGTREADCDEQSSFRGQTEWTSIRMPDSRCVVERT